VWLLVHDGQLFVPSAYATAKRWPGELVDHFELSQPTISHHLKALREAGLLHTTKVGVWSFYRVDPDGVAVLAETSALCEPAIHTRSGALAGGGDA
jgi:DNA-binding transcriptional ArsR family regulator